MRLARAAATGVATLALTVGVATIAVTSAAADPDPTPEQLQQAQVAVETQAQRVARLQGEWAAADQRVEATAVAAEQATEAFNGLRYALAQAKVELALAEGEAASARRQVDEQRGVIADMVVGSYRDVGQLSTVEAVVGADDPESMLARIGTVSSVNDAMQADFDAFRASSERADRAEQAATRARDRQITLLAKAREARDLARAQQRAAQAAAAALAGERERLVADLARAQGISRALVRQHQAALTKPKNDPRAPRAPKDKPKNPGTPTPPEPSPSPAPPTDPPSDPPPVIDQTPPPPSGGAASAIAFAKQQLGEPYRWGATGPDAWDCSGLVMRAWAAGGKTLPHWSVGQYRASTPIDRSALRPGDLVFWASSSSSSSIYHVAIYLGGGQIIHAPRTGRNVEIVSIDYWRAPDFFARP